MAAIKHGGTYGRGRIRFTVEQKVRLEIKAAYSLGYSAGYEDQMRMRILDAKERLGHA